ncbi:MAG TPA: PQQ-binding-like beta-propeller repeat protein [Vicinamibacterales bacterium]|nr:PQQ-binding-like beta-propeller repeat protein [Vicinamibacterales bacterium]
MKRTAIVLAVLFGAGSMLTGQAPAAGDWPQWRGPERSGVSRETGLLKQWPKGGPPLAWSAADLGAGYGSVAVAGSRVFVQGMRGRDSIVTSLNRADGKVAWSKVIGQARENDRGSGPRSTPTVDGDTLYVLTENGDLAALRVSDGTRIWQQNILANFRGGNPNWLVSESPLVDGNLVIVSPGGRGAGVVALDKTSGKTVWVSKELNDEAGYSSAVVADVQGVRTIMTLTSEAGVGLRASDGKLMWHYRQVANQTANIATPVYSDSKVFYSSAYGTGGALLALRADGAGQVKAQEVYFTRDMQNHHGGVVLVNGYLYGFNNAILTCLEFASGKPMWRDRSVGKGAVTAADGNLYVLSEDNVVGLVEATPAGYREKGRFTIRDQGLPSWAHPVVSGGHLYIRNQAVLASYDVRAK